MLMPDVPVTVPLAGLHPCAGFEAETDAVAAVGESMFATECSTMCVRSCPPSCPQSPPHMASGLLHHGGAGGLTPVPAGTRVPQSVQSLPSAHRSYALPAPPSSQSPSLTKLGVAHAFVHSTPKAAGSGPLGGAGGIEHARQPAPG